MSLPREFASDNTAPVHPEVLAAIAAANTGPSPAYGYDAWTERLRGWIHAEFGPETEIFPVWNGTGANVVSLRALVAPWQAVLCSREAHIQSDECGAPEWIVGCKLIDLESPDAKLTPGMLRAALRGRGDEHRVQPAAVSITQSTEYGTVYDPEELTELCRTAHALGLRVHMDGARLSNAAASLGVPLRAITRDVGVDILSFGATKNGAMAAEAVVTFRAELAGHLLFLRKQSMQLASKMRYLAAQLLTLGEGGLGLRTAAHANAMAARLARGLAGISGVEVTQRVQANAVFARLPIDVSTRLQERFHFYFWNQEAGEVRWMTNWATAPEDVDELLEAVRFEMSPRP